MDQPTHPTHELFAGIPQLVVEPGLFPLPTSVRRAHGINETAADTERDRLLSQLAAGSDQQAIVDYINKAFPLIFGSQHFIHRAVTLKYAVATPAHNNHTINIAIGYDTEDTDYYEEWQNDDLVDITLIADIDGNQAFSSEKTRKANNGCFTVAHVTVDTANKTTRSDFKEQDPQIFCVHKALQTVPFDAIVRYFIFGNTHKK
jgi:hypothetical protein